MSRPLESDSSGYEGEGPCHPAPDVLAAKNALKALFDDDAEQVTSVLESIGGKELGWDVVSQLVKLNLACQAKPRLKQGKILRDLVDRAVEGKDNAVELKTRAMAALADMKLDMEGAEEKLGPQYRERMTAVAGSERLRHDGAFGLGDLKDVPQVSRAEAREKTMREADEVEPGVLGDLVPGYRRSEQR